jgi:hypothetical protein
MKSTLVFPTVAKVARPVFDTWERFVSELNLKAPPGVHKATQTAYYTWTWMKTQEALVENTFSVRRFPNHHIPPTDCLYKTDTFFLVVPGADHLFRDGVFRVDVFDDGFKGWFDLHGDDRGRCDHCHGRRRARNNEMVLRHRRINRRGDFNRPLRGLLRAPRQRVRGSPVGLRHPGTADAARADDHGHFNHRFCDYHDHQVRPWGFPKSGDTLFLPLLFANTRFTQRKYGNT